MAHHLLLSHQQQCNKKMREGVRIADDQDDPGTADLFTQTVQIHEKYEWWLRDILEKRDGLTRKPHCPDDSCIFPTVGISLQLFRENLTPTGLNRRFF
jgi:hypothetical protein